MFVCKIVLVEDVGWVDFRIAGYHYFQYNVSATLYYQYSFVDKFTSEVANIMGIHGAFPLSRILIQF